MNFLSKDYIKGEKTTHRIREIFSIDITEKCLCTEYIKYGYT